jgi:hypothetical protein
MLGYNKFDLDEMINSVHDAKLFYLRTPSDLMDKTLLVNSLLKTNDFLQGLREEGYFNNES